MQPIFEDDDDQGGGQALRGSGEKGLVVVGKLVRLVFKLRASLAKQKPH